jgi:hypothetical protein
VVLCGAVVLSLAVAACGQDPNSSGDAAGGSAGGSSVDVSGGSTDSAAGGSVGEGSGGATNDGGSCPIATRVGRFSVEAQRDFGVVQGTVANGVVPTAIPDVIGDEGGCTVYRRRNLFCAEACVGTETCGEDGQCIPYPSQVSVGTVTISGLTQPVEMQPLEPGNTYFAPGVDNPPFAPEAEIALVAAGTTEMPGFQLAGRGFTALPSDEPPTWVLEEGADLSLTWAPPGGSVETTISVELTIDQHGLSPLSLVCQFEDTGSAEIPRSLVDQLITAGASGFPNGRIMRQTVDHANIAVGCVELVVGSPVPATVRIAGFTPCNGPEDCPTGQTCNTAIELCE